MKNKIVISYFLIVSFSSIFLSFKVYESFVDQNFLVLAGRGVFKDYTNEYVYSIQSTFPNITATTIPIETLKANLLLNNGVLEDTLLTMIEKGDKANPFIQIGNANRAVYFIKKNNLDSAYLYAKKAYYGLPKSDFHFKLLMDLIEIKRDTIELDAAYEFLQGPISESFTKRKLQVSTKIKKNLGKTEEALINSVLKNNSSDEYFNLFSKALDIGFEKTKDAFLFSKEGETLFSNKEFLKAAQKFELAIENNPNDIAYFENGANAYMQLNDYKKAIILLEREIRELDPRSGKAEYLLAISYMAENQKEIGCNYFTLAIQKGFKIDNKVVDYFCLELNKEKKEK